MNKWWKLAALAAAGAATVATGGAAAPALAAAGSAGAGAAGAGAAGAGLLGAGTAGAGAAGAGTAGLLGGAGTGAASGAGLLGNMGAAASYGTTLGSQQTAMLAAQQAGMGSMPISGSLLGGANSAMSTAKPFVQAAQTGMQIAGALTPQGGPAPAAPQLPQQNGAQTLQALAQQSPQMNIEQEAEMRKKRRMGLLGVQA